MTVRSLKFLLAATALGVGALVYSGQADAGVRGCGWRAHHGSHHAWRKSWRRAHRDDCVVASDDDVSPRRAYRDDDVVASDCDVAPRRVAYEDCVASSACDPRDGCRGSCIVASDYVAPPAYEPVYYAAPVVYVAPVVEVQPVIYTSGWWYSPYTYRYYGY
ncbi:hypothetical protein [Methylocystis bryophila]|nr:hypothetical protein [Methylocystis bryophila]BDV40346.1 hypothetical protein DSM21852_35990 [Methylocystis bryophila]